MPEYSLFFHQPLGSTEIRLLQVKPGSTTDLEIRSSTRVNYSRLQDNQRRHMSEVNSAMLEILTLARTHWQSMEFWYVDRDLYRILMVY
jgi:hypothetical protein